MKIDVEKIKKNKTTKELLEFGIININKPAGPTSFNISDYVRKSLKARKTSHFGTLDPKVTGVLPISINRACKLAGYFLGEDKTYVGIMRLHDDVDLEKIREAIKEKFIGEIIQMPPVKSAVKRQLRPRTIYSFDLLEKNDKDVLFDVKCEGGTYIRTLCNDLGEHLGVGAHMLELRRTDAGIFFENDKEYPSVNLYDFSTAVEEYENGNDEKLRKIIIPGEIVSELHPVVQIKKDAVKRIFHGSPVHKDEVVDKKVLDFETGKRFVGFSGDQFVGMFKVIEEGNLFARSEFTLQPVR